MTGFGSATVAADGELYMTCHWEYISIVVLVYFYRLVIANSCWFM